MGYHEPGVPSPSLNRRTVIRSIAAAAATAGFGAGTSRAAQAPQPVTSHPRLWLTQDDLPRIRRYASEDNPLWIGRHPPDRRRLRGPDRGRA